MVFKLFKMFLKGVGFTSISVVTIFLMTVFCYKNPDVFTKIIEGIPTVEGKGTSSQP